MKVKEDKVHRLSRLMLIIFLFTSVSGLHLSAQTMNVTGKVTDASTGEALIGVTVTIEGTNSGTTTGMDGAFRINAREGQTLKFNYLSHREESVRIGSNHYIEVSMTESAHAIENVVVMGYGANVSKVDAIGAVAAVSADQIEKRVASNIFDALRGEMAGVRITSSSGAPGDAMKIRVRGLTTFEDDGVSPLYVVDGFIVDDISNINVNDVESVNVLKDAASAAIYGSRAAAGVVMVTTKSGKPGKTKINVNYTQKFGFISNTLPQANRKEADILSGTVFSYSKNDQFAWLGVATDSVNIANSTSYFYQDLITQMGITTQINLSATGGSDKMQYAASAGYLRERGIVLTSSNQRANARIKADYKPSKKFRMSTNVALTYTNKDAVDEGSIFYNATRRMPQTWLYYPTDGTYVPSWGSYPNSGKRNPLAEIYERTDITNRYQATVNQQVVFNILPDLTFTGNGKVNAYYQERERFNSEWVQGTNYVNNYLAGHNSLTLNDAFYMNYSLEGFFNYIKTFKENHNFSAMAGTSIEYARTKNTQMSGTYLATDSKLVPQQAGTMGVPTLTGNVWSIASFFGRASYDYKKRYMISALLRYDGSSRFGPENRWGVFPSVQAGWRFSDHFKDTPVHQYFNDAKLRVSWGITGNDRIGTSDYLSLYSLNMNNGYNGKVGAVQNTSPGNNYLQWEQTQETNFGLDLQFFKGRLRVETDFYVQKTSYLLDNEPLPSELGYSTMRVNAGKIRNTGWEVAVMAYPIETRDWEWSTSLTWSRNKNKVLELSGTGGRIYETNWWLEVGQTPGQWYGFKQLGVYAYDANNAYTADFSERLNPVFQRDSHGNVMFDADRKPIVTGYTYRDGKTFEGTPQKLSINGVAAQGGDVMWDDVNRDGVINDEDKQTLGNGYPDWYMGWNNSVRWKNLTLSFSFYYSHGGLIYNNLLYQLSQYSDNTSASDPRAAVQGWRYQGQQTIWHIPGAGTQNGRATVDNGRSLSSFYLEDGSYLRLQDIRLSYDFDRALINRIKLASLQVYVYGGNLLTWTNYRGYDPEISTGGVLNPGRDNARYPRSKEVGFGVIIGF